MKYLSAIILTLFMQNAFANSQVFSSSQSNNSQSTPKPNVSQQTGGNYIFVENGKLTFNLEPSLFENRTWKFDQKTDAAVVAFETNLPLKTKNSSDFHVYELQAGYKVYEFTNGEMKFVRATIEKPPKGGLMHPVYTPKAGKGQTYHVWLPALVWTVRIVGAVARQVLPPIITRAATSCAATVTCTKVAIGVGVTSIHGAVGACIFNYHYDGAIRKYFNLPKTVCEKAEKNGWKKKATSSNNSSNTSSENDYYRTYKYTVYGYFGSKELYEKCPECVNDFREFTFGVDSEEEAWQKLREKCYAITSVEDKVESSTWFGLSGEVKKSLFSGNLYNTYGGMCSGTAEDEHGEFPFTAFRAWLEHTPHEETDTPHEETMQIVDISNLIVEDFKSDPTPYINDNGQVGKELRESIKSSAEIQKKDGSEGTLTASSEPYIDPDSGAVKQDILSITSNNSPILPPINSGSGSGFGSGSGNGSSSVNGSNNPIPTGKNDVSMQTIDRPDLTNEAKPAANNKPNGTGVGSSTGSDSGSDSNNGSGSGSSQNGGVIAASGVGQGKDDNKEGCENQAASYPSSSNEPSPCAASSVGFDFSIPTKEVGANYAADNFLPSSGVCPAPKVFHVVGKQYEVSYEPICRIASDVRFAVLIAFAVMAALVAFGGLRKN